MISKLSDEDALDMLMTSEFNENYTPKQMREMLLKYRYFYRILHSRYERLREDSGFEIERREEVIRDLRGQVASEQMVSATRQDEIDALRGRRLSWRERLTGKIMYKDED